MVYQFPACTSLCKFWVTRQFRIQWYTGPKTLQMRGHCKIVQTKRVFQVDLLSKSSWLVKSSSLASEAIFSSVNVGFGDEFWKLGKSIFSSSTEFAGGTVDFSKDAGISVVLGFSWLFLGEGQSKRGVSLASLESKCLHAVEWHHFLPWWFQAVFG